VLRVESDAVAVERQVWQPEAKSFALERTERFRRQASRWIEAS
jgi:hypothetical protein